MFFPPRDGAQKFFGDGGCFRAAGQEMLRPVDFGGLGQDGSSSLADEFIRGRVQAPSLGRPHKYSGTNMAYIARLAVMTGAGAGTFFGSAYVTFDFGVRAAAFTQRRGFEAYVSGTLSEGLPLDRRSALDPTYYVTGDVGVVIRPGRIVSFGLDAFAAGMFVFGRWSPLLGISASIRFTAGGRPSRER